MRKLVRALLCIAGPVFFALAAHAQTTVTIGSGTATARYPLSKWYGFHRGAMIYTASEIGTAGTIDRLAFYVTAAQSGTLPVRIFLAHTTASTLSTGNWATKTTGSTVVFADSFYTLSAGGWNTFTLPSSFAYDGTSNLMVMVETNWGGGGNGDGTLVQYSTATSQHWYANADNNPPTTNGTVNSNRPNIQIRITPPPVPNLKLEALISPLLGGCNATTYNLEFQTKNVGSAAIPSGSYVRYGYTQNNGSAVVDSVQLSSDLSPNGTYNFQVNGVNVGSIVNHQFKVWANIDTDPGKLNDSATYNVTNPNCMTTNLASDFESNDAGLVVTGGLWAWGTSSKAPFSTPTSGTRMWATDLTANYPNYALAILEFPFFAMTSVCAPTFTWNMRYDMEMNYDAVVLEATTDNVNWTRVNSVTPVYNSTSAFGPITPNKWSGDNTTWTTYVADLSAFAGQTALKLRLRFGSDVSGTDFGVAIDDIDFSLFPSYSGLQITAPDSAYVNAMYDVEITSTATTKAGVSFQWQLDGVTIANTLDLDYAFPNTGTFELKQKAISACGVTLDSSITTVVVINPPAKPNADFIASKNNVAAFEVFTMTNLTDNGATDYTWYVNPDIYIDPNTQLPLPSVSYSGGTTANSKNPQMAFFGDGVYDVCLIAENALGIDTNCKVQYIFVGSSSGSSGDSIMCAGTGTSSISGRIYDSGGPNANYLDNENCIFTIEFKCHDSLLLDFSAFDVETDWDFLFAYDGDVNGTPLWNTAIYPDGMTGNAIPVLNPATSGMVTLVFTSDGIFNNPGFVLNYQAVSQVNSAPVADFIVPDTLCAAYYFTFDNQSTNAYDFYWDFFGNGTTNSTDKDPTYIYATGGTYNIRLVAEGCAGTDTIVKPIVVTNPGQNQVAFGSQYTRYTTNDVVTLVDSTQGCVDNYFWKISPDRATFLGSEFDPVTTVRFDTAGFYTVTLITENAAGLDSTVRTNYLEIVNICGPTVSNNIADLGISRVVFADLDNSTAAKGGYSDYNIAATVEQGRDYTLSVHRSSASNEVSRNIWIDWNGDGDFDDAGELVASEGPARTKVFTEQIGIPRTAVSGLVTMRVSTSYGSQPNTSCGNRMYGETEDYRVIVVPDTKAPVITLIGSNPVFVNRGDTYTDDGATAMDNLDGNLTQWIVTGSNVNTSVAGQYQVTYDVADSAGNNAVQVIRTVIVHPDAPVIVLNGLNPDTMDVFNPYADMGASATDFDNNFLPVTVVSHIDSSVTGSYLIEYSATDANGRTTTITRTVVVVDRVAPTAMLNGDDTITVEVFSTIPDAGISIGDNYCATGQYTIDPISSSVLGYFDMVYRFSDCEGNESTITRVVHVVDTEAPVITLKGAVGVNHYRQHAYLDSGYNLSDNYYASGQITVETLTTLVNTETIGLYTLQYRATDGSGNTSLSETRFIYIIDNVSVEDIELSDLSVYPNPSAGNFTVGIEAFKGEKVSIVVSDLSGKQIQVQNLEGFAGTQAIDLSEQAAGMYLVHVISGNRQAVAKVMIAK